MKKNKGYSKKPQDERKRNELKNKKNRNRGIFSNNMKRKEEKDLIG